MKCKCEKPIESVRVEDVTAHSEIFRGTIRCVAYTCPHCGLVLGVESHPLERDAQMTAIKNSVAKIAADSEIVLRKLTKPPVAS